MTPRVYVNIPEGNRHGFLSLFSLQISKSKEQLSAGNEQRAEVMEQQERSATLEAELKKMRRKVQTNTKVIESQEQAQKGLDRSIGTFSKFGLKKKPYLLIIKAGRKSNNLWMMLPFKVSFIQDVQLPCLVVASSGNHSGVICWTNQTAPGPWCPKKDCSIHENRQTKTMFSLWILQICRYIVHIIYIIYIYNVYNVRPPSYLCWLR